MYNLALSDVHDVVGVMRGITDFMPIYYNNKTGDLVFEDEASQTYFMITELAIAQPTVLATTAGVEPLVAAEPECKGLIAAEEGFYYIYNDDSCICKDALGQVIKEQFFIDTNIGADLDNEDYDEE